MDQIRRKCPQIFILIIVLIVAMLYLVQMLLCLLINPFSQLATVIFLIFYHFFCLMFLWSFIVTINSEPGTVPMHWGFYLQDEDKKRRKYCLICHVFKPQRCHHCSQCNKCVLNMDHHCPWINNCIGFKNRKFFILMLIYTTMTTLIEGIGLGCGIPAVIEKFGQNVFVGILVFLFFILDIIIFFLIGYFLKFHLQLIFKNSTTLQNLDVKRMNRDNNRQMEYDAGCYFNWIQVFGRSGYLWAFPFFCEGEGPFGDGVIWYKQQSKQSD